MHRKFHGDAAGSAYAFAHAVGKLQVVPIARTEIGPALGDADDRLPGSQYVAREPVIQIALQIKRRHARIVRIVEPQLRVQTSDMRTLRVFNLHSTAPNFVRVTT